MSEQQLALILFGSLFLIVGIPVALLLIPPLLDRIGREERLRKRNKNRYVRVVYVEKGEGGSSHGRSTDDFGGWDFDATISNPPVNEEQIANKVMQKLNPTLRNIEENTLHSSNSPFNIWRESGKESDYFNKNKK